MKRLALGIVSDEVSPDFSEAARHAASWDISLFELRVLKTGRIPSIDPAEAREALSLVRSQGLRVTALSPGMYKLPVSQSTKLEAELSETLPRTLSMAQEFCASMVIVFGFQRDANEPQDNFHRAVEWMERAAERAGREGIRLVIENEPGFWCDSGANTATVIKSVNSPWLRANWDPCNGYGTPERPFPEGYASIRPYVANVHVKDTIEGSLIRCVPVGTGAVDWKGQLAALVQDGTVDHVTLETHCLPLIENSKQNADTVRKYLSEIYSSLENQA